MIIKHMYSVNVDTSKHLIVTTNLSMIMVGNQISLLTAQLVSYVFFARLVYTDRRNYCNVIPEHQTLLRATRHASTLLSQVGHARSL